MADADRAGRFIVNGECSNKCTLSAARLGDVGYRKVHTMYEAGLADEPIVAAAAQQGIKVSKGSVFRHRNNHLTNFDDLERDDSLAQLTELEAIDLAIKMGQRGIKNWNMTPTEWKGFVELKHKLTEGTVFDGFVAAVASASQEDDEPEQSAPVAGDVQGEDVEDTEEPSVSVREALPDGRSARRPEQMARPIDAGYQYAGSGEQVGQDVRDSDEAHPDVRVQEGTPGDATGGLDERPVPDGEHGSVVRPSGSGVQGSETPDFDGGYETLGQEVESDPVPIG